MSNRRALSFKNFINEAYVDEFGELQDFDFSMDHDDAAEWAEKGERGKDPKAGWKTLLLMEFEELLKDLGAKNLVADNSGEFANFSFNWNGELYLIVLEAGEDYAEVIHQKTNEKGQVVKLDQLYNGGIEELTSYFLQSGMDLLDQF
jgi:hypothetical protein